MISKKKALEMIDVIANIFPDAECELKHDNAFELTIAVRIPETHKELESLAGVGRKTANVVMSVAFGEPSLAVDTHVERVSKRLGINRWKDNVRQVEDRLCDIIPRERWNRSHHQLIFFGRYHCLARKPKCDICPLLDDCREGQKRYKASLKEA